MSFGFGSLKFRFLNLDHHSWLGRGGGREGGGALQEGGLRGGGGRELVGDGGSETWLSLHVGKALFGGGVYQGGLLEDGGEVDGRGGKVEVGEGGK